MQRGREKIPWQPVSKGSHEVPGEPHPLDRSPVMMKEEDISPHPKCFTETRLNSLWTATAYDGVSTDQSTLIWCKHYTSTDF